MYTDAERHTKLRVAGEAEGTWFGSRALRNVRSIYNLKLCGFLECYPHAKKPRGERNTQLPTFRT